LIIGSIFILVGGIWILDNFRLIDFEWDWFWPAGLIILGVYILYHSRKSKGYHFAGDQNRVFTGEIDGLTLNQTFGSLKMDLTKAVLKPGLNRVKASVVMGEIRITCPVGEAVHAEGSVVIGDVEIFGDKRDWFNVRHEVQTPGYADASKKLLIDADVVLGDIKIKKE